MFGSQAPSTYPRKFLSAIMLLACVPLVAAQHHGGHGMGGSMSGGMSRPGGVEETDTLKDFHRALAVQATSPQIAAFQELVKATNAAKEKVGSFEQASGQAREGIAPVDEALATARNLEKKFQDGFSEAQKNGLKEDLKRIEKADADLDQESKRLDQSISLEAAKTGITARAETLDKALATFAGEQLALGREMGIVLASAQDLAFNLPAVNSVANVGNRKVALVTSGRLAQTDTANGVRTFQLELASDLSDFQHNIPEIMAAAVDEGGSCGERLIARGASIEPAAPASSLMLQLHYERWTCSAVGGRSAATELAESDGVAELKLTASFDKSNALAVDAQFKRIDATGMMAESLRTGNLGADLRDKASKAVLSALHTAADLKTDLPPAIQSAATVQSVRFQDIAPGILGFVMQGQVKASSEQVSQLATQLNQTLSAQSAAPQ